MTNHYPPDDRSGLWSWDVVKLLIRHRIAKRLGSAPAALIIAAVAAGEHREDYLVPPAFWNKELMDAAGLEDEKAFIRARTRACDSGWLAYRKGRIREAGQYWVTLPEWAAKGMRVQKASHAPAMRQPCASHAPVITTLMRQSSPPPFSPSPFPCPKRGGESTPTPPAGDDDPKTRNAQAMKKILRGRGMSSSREAIVEWSELLQGDCGCKTIDEGLWALVWLISTVRESGAVCAYAKHAGHLGTRCRRAVRDRRKQLDAAHEQNNHDATSADQTNPETL